MPLRLDVKCKTTSDMTPGQISNAFKQALAAMFTRATVVVNTTARDAQEFRNKKIQLSQAQEDVARRTKLGANYS